MSVVVPLSQEQSVQVIFRQEAVLLDEERTQFAVFPPLNPKAERSPVVQVDGAGQFTITKVSNGSIAATDKTLRYAVSTLLDPHDFIVREGAVIDNETQSGAVLLIETSQVDPKTYGKAYWLPWSSEKLLIRSVDKLSTISLSSDPYLLLTSKERINEGVFTLRYYLSNTLEAQSLYTIFFNAQASTQSCKISRVYTILNKSDVDFEKIDSLSVVESTLEASAVPQYTRARGALRYDEVVSSSSSMMQPMSDSSSSSYTERENRSLLLSPTSTLRQTTYKPTYFMHTQQTSIPPGGCLQLNDPTEVEVGAHLVYHIENLVRSGRSSVVPFLWLQRDGVNKSIVGNFPTTVIIDNLADERLAQELVWDKSINEDNADDIPWEKITLRSPGQSYINVFATESTRRSKQTLTTINIVNNYNAPITFAVAVYSSQVGKCTGVQVVTKDAQSSSEQPWEASAYPSSYVVFTVPPRKLDFLLTATFS